MAKKRKNKDKFKAIAGLVMTALVGIGFIAYALNTETTKEKIVILIIAAMIIFFLGLFFIKRYRDVKSGMPYEDERSKRVIEKAAAMSFYVTIYLLLVVGIVSENLVKFRDVSQATGLSIGGMAILFFIFWIYYSRKGN